MIIKLNRLNVNKVNGSDKIVKIGFINIFRIERIKVVIIVGIMFFIWIMLGKIIDKEMNVSVLIINCWKYVIKSYFICYY